VFGPYRQLAAVPGLPAVLVWSMVGRLHLTGTALAMTFLVAGWTGSYVPAGVIGGAYTLGVAVGGPMRGRSADRGDAPALLLVTGVGYAAGLGAIAVTPTILASSAWPVLAVAAFVVALVQPPVGQISRAAWPRVAEGAALHSLFTVEATLQELLFVLGPVLAAGTVAVVNATAAVLLCAALAVFGAIGFALALRRAGLGRPAEPALPTVSGSRSILTAPGIPAAIAMALCVIAPLMIVDMLIVAWARDRGSPGLAGLLVAVWAVGSAAGGLVVGGMSGRPRLARRIAIMAIGVGLLVPLLPPLTDAGPWLIGVVLAVGGMAVAPAIATANARIGELAPEGRAAETFGWLLTAATAGSAVALPVSGWLLDHIGPAAAAGAATVLAAAAAGLAVAVPEPALVTDTVAASR